MKIPYRRITVFFSIIININAIGQANLQVPTGTITSGDYAASNSVYTSTVTPVPTTSLTPTSNQQIHLYIDNSIPGNVNYVTQLSSDINQTLNPNLPVGKTQSSYGVSSSGAANYNVPIQVPPGTMGMVPSLSINYNSQTAQGLLGYGWNLAGLSSISLLGQTPYHNYSNNYPDQSHAVTFGTYGSDWFALDGNRLITTSGSYGTPGSTYATENETFNLITFNSAGYFLVNTKDGLTIEYGKTSDSKLIPTGQTATYAWLIDNITDQFGNYISFKYNNSNGEAHIQEIDYTGNANAGFAPYNSIIFNYGIKNDPNTLYVGQGGLNSTVVLNSITIYSHGNFFKQYSFKYCYNICTMLQEIDEMGADHSTLNPMVFSYTNDAPTPTQVGASANDLTLTNSNFDFIRQFALLDYKGNGRKDLVDMSGTKSVYFSYDNQTQSYTPTNCYTENWNPTRTLWENTSAVNTRNSPWFSSVASPNLPPWEPNWTPNGSPLLFCQPGNSNAPGDLGQTPMDFNGDGKEDMASSTFQISYNEGSDVEEDVNIGLSIGNGFANSHALATYNMNPHGFGQTCSPDGEGGFGSTYYVTMNMSGTFYLDMNGDGQMDIFNYHFDPSSNLEYYRVWLNAGSSSTIPQEQYSTTYPTLPSNPPNANFEITVNEPPFQNSYTDPNWYNTVTTNSYNYLDFSNAFPMDLDGDGREELVNVIQYTGSDNISACSGTNANSQRVIVRFDASQVYGQPNYVGESDGSPGFAGIPGNGIEIITDNSSIQYCPTTYITSFDSYGYVSSVTLNTNIGQYELFGDFNGDGISDVLTNNWSNTGFTLNLGMGAGTYTAVPVSTIPGENPASYPNVYYYAHDMNGDGKTDVVEFIQQPNGNYSKTLINVFYSTGASFINGPQVWTWGLIDPTKCQINFADFDGDGVDDIFYYNELASFQGNEYTPEIIYLYKGAHSRYLAEAVDGYDEKVKFYYQPISNDTYSNPNFYTQPNANNYPSNSLIDIQQPLYFVTRLTTPGNTGNETTNTNYDLIDTNSTTYFYQDAICNSTGLGFLGFLNVTSINSISDYKTSVTNTVQNVPATSFPCELLPSQTSIVYAGNNQTLYEDNYTYANPILGGLRYFLPLATDVHDDDVLKVATTTSYSYDNYGNPTDMNMQSSVLNTSAVVETSDVSKTYVSSGTWIPSKVELTTTTLTQYGELTYQSSEPSYQRITQNTWDNAGHLEQTVQDPSSATNAVTTANNYDPNTGVLLIHITYAPSCQMETTSYTYDPYSQFAISITNPLGQVSNYNYDYIWGKPTQEITPDGLSTFHVYDAYGRTIQIITPDYLQKNISYNWTTSGDFPLGSSQPFNISPSGLNTALYTVYSQKNGSPSLKTYYDWFGRENGTASDGFNGLTIYTEKSYDLKGNLYRSTTPYVNGGPDAVVKANYHDDIYRLIQTDVLDYLDSAHNSNAPPLITTFSYSPSSSLGTMTTTTNQPDGKISSETTDPSGLLVTSIDYNGSTLNYTYFSNRKTQSVYLDGNQIESYTYDPFAGLSSMYDQNFTSPYTYTFNAYNQLTYQQDPNGNIYNSFNYDVLGRLTTKTGTEGTYNYSYVTSGNGLNLPRTVCITNNNGTVTNSYSYDRLRRPVNVTENGLTTSFQYDIYNNVIKKTYPGGFAIKNQYDNFGNLTQTNRADNGALIWQANAMNALGQYTAYTLGNGVQTQKNFTPYNYLTNISASGIQNLALNFDPTNGNLLSRTDNIAGLSEIFSYTDNMNRLNEASSQNADVLVSYDPNGNIISKSDICQSSAYTDGNGNNQVTSVPNNSYNVINPAQNISYAPFNAPSSISQGGYSLTFTYGPNDNRVLSSLTDPMNNITTRYFASGYEKTLINNLNPTEVNYINCGGSLVAMYVNQPSGGNLYYVYTDHLGSILTLTDGSSNLIAKQSFDAWGNFRNPVDWSYSTFFSTNPSWLYRGFTGHEYLPQFQLINMNARLYDPFEGDFLSPDKDLQQPGNTQNYNKYAYCLNNPLKYSDPSGNYFLLDDIGLAVVGGIINATVNICQGNVHNFGQCLEYFGAGAAAGAAFEYTGPIGSGAILAGLNSVITQANTTGKIDIGNVVTSAAIGAGTAWATSALLNWAFNLDGASVAPTDNSTPNLNTNTGTTPSAGASLNPSQITNSPVVTTSPYFEGPPNDIQIQDPTNATITVNNPEYGSLPVGRSGQPLGGVNAKLPMNATTNINGYIFDGHALDQMQAKGILSPTLVSNTIEHATLITPVNNGYFNYFANGICVRYNPTTNVIITIYPQ